MPIKIRSKADFERFYQLLNQLEQAVASGQLSLQEVIDSNHRIQNLKRQFKLDTKNPIPVREQVALANKTLASKTHKHIEQKLAENSLTVIKGNGRLWRYAKKLHLLMPDQAKCLALTRALLKQKDELVVTCSSQLNFNLEKEKQNINHADAFLSALITPSQSAVERGGMDDLSIIKKNKRKNIWQQRKQLKQLLKYARNNGRQSIFVTLRSPYEAKRFNEVSHDIIATFSYNHHQSKQNGETVILGSTYTALAKLLTEKIKPVGQLPVSF